MDPAPLLKRAGIWADALSLDTRISVMGQIEFLNLAAQATADRWIGLTLAADFDLREMGLLYYVAASSRRLGEALHRLERYVRVGNEALVLRIRKGTLCRVGLSYAGVPRHLDNHQIEFLGLAFLRLCRQLVGRNVMPVSTCFVHHRSGDLVEARRCFGEVVGFDAPVDELCLEAALLDAPLVNADPFLNRLMLKNCEEALAGRSKNVGPLRIVVENTIAPLLPHGDVRAGTVARKLGLSERTLARRLKLEGVTFVEVLNDLRRELAIHYLEDQSLSISHIAWLLGFHGPTGFSHAFQRWRGKSAAVYRRDHLSF